MPPTPESSPVRAARRRADEANDSTHRGAINVDALPTTPTPLLTTKVQSSAIVYVSDGSDIEERHSINRNARNAERNRLLTEDPSPVKSERKSSQLQSVGSRHQDSGSRYHPYTTSQSAPRHAGDTSARSTPCAREDTSARRTSRLREDVRRYNDAVADHRRRRTVEPNNNNDERGGSPTPGPAHGRDDIPPAHDPQDPILRLSNHDAQVAVSGLPATVQAVADTVHMLQHEHSTITNDLVLAISATKALNTSLKGLVSRVRVADERATAAFARINHMHGQFRTQMAGAQATLQADLVREMRRAANAANMPPHAPHHQ